MKIRDLRFAPPGNWRYQEARTGFWSRGCTFEQMVGHAAQHRINMNFPIVNPPYDTLAQEIQAWLCGQMSEADRQVHCEEATKKTLVTQPGHMFSLVISKITGRYAVTCGRCMERMGQMNRWGWWGCWRNRETIVNWMLDEAAGRGHRVSREHVFSLFQAALHEIRQSRKRILEQDGQAP
jgi:hypothetical protein